MQNDTGSSPIVFLYLFLVATGAYSIIVSLIQLKNNKDNPSHGSSLETKWFKFNAPAGFVYGLFAILTVIGIAKYTSFSEYRAENTKMASTIAQLRNENAYLKSINRVSDNTITKFDVIFIRNEPKSIFGGKVIIVCDRSVFSDSKLIFKGIIGIAKNANEQFSGSVYKFEQGDKFYIKLENNDIWGVNVLNTHGNVTIELYKT